MTIGLCVLSILVLMSSLFLVGCQTINLEDYELVEVEECDHVSMCDNAPKMDCSSGYCIGYNCFATKENCTTKQIFRRIK